MDDLRFRTQQSPRNEPPMNTFVSPPRNGTRLPQPVSSHDQQRANLPRRFTADSARVPTLSNIGNARGQEQPPPPQDYTAVRTTPSVSHPFISSADATQTNVAIPDIPQSAIGTFCSGRWGGVQDCNRARLFWTWHRPWPGVGEPV